MEATPVKIDRDLVDILEEVHRPAKQAARELIVLELYRQGEVSSGRAARLLGKEREENRRETTRCAPRPVFNLSSADIELFAPQVRLQSRTVSRHRGLVTAA
jgi:predicted HTH domain antitoxin